MTTYTARFASFYDSIYSMKDYEFESSFIANLTPSGGRLLDIGCGTLSHSLLLSHNFQYILGIDNSDEMLQEARKKIQSAGSENIALKNIRLSQLPTRGNFDVAISLFNVINHIMEFSELIEFFSLVYNQLRPGGKFIFDFWNGAFYRSEPPTEIINKLFTSSAGLIEVETRTETDLMQGVAIMHSKFKVKNPPGVDERFNISMSHRLWTPDLIIELLNLARFVEISLIPAFDESRVASHCDRKIMVVCSK